MIATGLYLNNILIDLARIFGWGSAFHTSEESKEAQDEAVTFANFRFVMSIIMGVTWGVVFIL